MMSKFVKTHIPEYDGLFFICILEFWNMPQLVREQW